MGRQRQEQTTAIASQPAKAQTQQSDSSNDDLQIVLGNRAASHQFRNRLPLRFLRSTIQPMPQVPSFRGLSRELAPIQPSTDLLIQRSRDLVTTSIPPIDYSEDKNYYKELFDREPDARAKQQLYYKLSRRLHPDKHPELAEKFKAMTAAYKDAVEQGSTEELEDLLPPQDVPLLLENSPSSQEPEKAPANSKKSKKRSKKKKAPQAAQKQDKVEAPTTALARLATLINQIDKKFATSSQYWNRRGELMTLKDNLRQWRKKSNPDIKKIQSAIQRANDLSQAWEAFLSSSTVAPDSSLSSSSSSSSSSSTLVSTAAVSTTTESTDMGEDWEITSYAKQKKPKIPHPSDSFHTAGGTIDPAYAIANQNNEEYYGTHNAAFRVNNKLRNFGHGPSNETNENFKQVRIDNHNTALGRIYIGDQGTYYWGRNLSHVKGNKLNTTPIYWFNPASGWQKIQGS